MENALILPQFIDDKDITIQSHFSSILQFLNIKYKVHSKFGIVIIGFIYFFFKPLN